MEKGEGVFNGDTGTVREINGFAETMTVEFDEGRMVEYGFKQLEELELAYAITIHKSQGSEYPAVVIPGAQRPQDADDAEPDLHGRYQGEKMRLPGGASRDCFRPWWTTSTEQRTVFRLKGQDPGD